MGSPPRGKPPVAPVSPVRQILNNPFVAIAVAVGVGAVGAYMLDLHGHTCDQCGRRWRHLGAFNLGDEESHTCSRCGQVQWWKCGAPHVLRGSVFAGPSASQGLAPQPRALPPAPTPPSLPTVASPYASAYASPLPAARDPYARTAALPSGALRLGASPHPQLPTRRRLT